jgi:hypothetical protein
MSTPCKICATAQRGISLERNAGQEYIAPPRFWSRAQGAWALRAARREVGISGKGEKGEKGLSGYRRRVRGQRSDVGGQRTADSWKKAGS